MKSQKKSPGCKVTCHVTLIQRESQVPLHRRASTWANHLSDIASPSFLLFPHLSRLPLTPFPLPPGIFPLPSSPNSSPPISDATMRRRTRMHGADARTPSSSSSTAASPESLTLTPTLDAAAASNSLSSLSLPTGRDSLILVGHTRPTTTLRSVHQASFL